MTSSSLRQAEMDLAKQLGLTRAESRVVRDSDAASSVGFHKYLEANKQRGHSQVLLPNIDRGQQVVSNTYGAVSSSQTAMNANARYSTDLTRNKNNELSRGKAGSSMELRSGNIA